MNFKYTPAYDTFEPQPLYWPGYMAAAGISRDDYEKAQKEKQEKIEKDPFFLNED